MIIIIDGPKAWARPYCLKVYISPIDECCIGKVNGLVISVMYVLYAALHAQILQCMNKDSSRGKMERVYVDGGMTCNNFFLQLLANILGIPVGKG